MTLSVCMIVKDEEETLARCLNCVKPFADEIVIVDTGSVDGTKNIAGAFTDKIFDFDWSDDFSAARNFSFSKANCDLIMWLDADDIITADNAAKIAALKEREDFDVVFLQYAAAFDGDRPTFIYTRERIFRRTLNLKWKGAVHEAIEPSGRIIHSNACIYHKKIKAGDAARNLNIYQKRIRSGAVLDAREKFYYGRELYFNRMFTEAEAVLSDFLNGGGWVENMVEACRTLYKINMQLGREYAAVTCLLRAFSFSFPRAEDCCALAAYFENKGEVRSAIYWYERALSTGESVSDGGFINMDYCDYVPALRLCVIYDGLGDTERAEYYNEIAGAAKPNDGSYSYNKKYFQKKFNEVKI